MEQRFRIRIRDEFRGSLRSLAYACARASGVVFGFFTIATSSRRFAACFAASFFRFSFRTTADVFAMLPSVERIACLVDPWTHGRWPCGAYARFSFSSPRNGIPSSRSSASARSSRPAVVTIVMSIPWICSTMS